MAFHFMTVLAVAMTAVDDFSSAARYPYGVPDSVPGQTHSIQTSM
jgi:hypothetical protein